MNYLWEPQSHSFRWDEKMRLMDASKGFHKNPNPTYNYYLWYINAELTRDDTQVSNVTCTLQQYLSIVHSVVFVVS